TGAGAAARMRRAAESLAARRLHCELVGDAARACGPPEPCVRALAPGLARGEVERAELSHGSMWARLIVPLVRQSLARPQTRLRLPPAFRAGNASPSSLPRTSEDAGSVQTPMRCAQCAEHKKTSTPRPTAARSMRWCPRHARVADAIRAGASVAPVAMQDAAGGGVWAGKGATVERAGRSPAPTLIHEISRGAPPPRERDPERRRAQTPSPAGHGHDRCEVATSDLPGTSQDGDAR